MSQDLEVARLIDATAEQVFDAFTNPAGQEAFYGKDDPGWIVQSQCDLHVGGVWTVDFGSSPPALCRQCRPCCAAPRLPPEQCVAAGRV